ncbi:MAG: ABC transporter substrate-binding protein, partial [Oscillospiraceae bacterium]
VRQALSYAIDKKAIVDAVYSGVGTVGTGPLASTVWGYEPDVKQYEYNPEKAKELLKEAGIPEGFEVKITTSDSQVRADTAEIMQNQLNAVGIKSTVEVLENSTYLDKVVEGSLDIFILGWTTTSGDADYGLQPFLSTSPSWTNTTFYNDPKVDDLLIKAKTEQDATKRKELYSEAQKIIAEDAPIIFLQQGEEVYATRNNVKGAKVTAANRFFLNEITFE